MTNFKEKLFSLKDETYKEFHCKLMPTVDPFKVIGVRTPAIRALSKEFLKNNKEEVGSFMNELPHEYYEENNLHAVFIEAIKDFDECINELDRFLPFVDNWATCDMLRPKVLKKDKQRLLLKINEWLKSEHIYIVRFAIGMLMVHFLKEDFSLEYPETVSEIKSEEYYIKMMIAWYFATALSENYEAVLPFIKERKLDRWTHNKAIQKATESYQISNEKKSELKKLKIK